MSDRIESEVVTDARLDFPNLVALVPRSSRYREIMSERETLILERFKAVSSFDLLLLQNTLELLRTK